ncbi:MAG TPA: hypothetical protein VFU02_00185 [Polyangiaceae bacterium]|nr:hypothetical protein [Polyangiaceae bacterium]
MSEVHIWVYRDFENRRVGEPDDGTLAWRAHLERETALREVLDDPGLSVTWSREMIDRERPHELAEVVVAVLAKPSTQAVLLGAAAYVSKVIAGQVDKLLGDAVASLFGKLVERFKKKRIGDFWIQCSDGTRISVDPNGAVSMSFKDGKLQSFHLDNAPQGSRTNGDAS